MLFLDILSLFNVYYINKIYCIGAKRAVNSVQNMYITNCKKIRFFNNWSVVIRGLHQGNYKTSILHRRNPQSKQLKENLIQDILYKDCKCI